MDILISEWALNSYLELKQGRTFKPEEYENILRPDVLRLKHYPFDAKFELQQFWSIAECPLGIKIPDGFKMKWDSVGDGRIELRLPVAILTEAVLCEAYVKRSGKVEQRQLARFKTHLQLAKLGRFKVRGRLK
jgi:hypothetical protein